MPATVRPRDAVATRAVAEIAGELDDVVAHALSAMTVQAAAARRLTLTRPEAARAAFAAIEAAGREALDELRRLLGVLRREEHHGIARELHDLVAHSTTVMVVQAGGARRILDRDPTRAVEAAARIERTGRDALRALRQAHDGAALAPQPRLVEIGALVSRARAAGLPVTLSVDGEPRALAAGLELAAYRIVEEALTNALTHAGGAAAAVSVEWSERALALEVRDRGAGARHGAPGHGLAGIRERVRLYGGELDAGPAPGGGWRVRAVFPFEALT